MCAHAPWRVRGSVCHASLIASLLVGYPAVRLLKAERVAFTTVRCVRERMCVCEGQLAGAVSFPISLPSRAGFDLSAARSKALSGY